MYMYDDSGYFVKFHVIHPPTPTCARGLDSAILSILHNESLSNSTVASNVPALYRRLSGG